MRLCDHCKHKKCADCGKWFKDLRAFGLDVTQKDGLSATCKACRKKIYNAGKDRKFIRAQERQMVMEKI